MSNAWREHVGKALEGVLESMLAEVPHVGASDGSVFELAERVSRVSCRDALEASAEIAVNALAADTSHRPLFRERALLARRGPIQHRAVLRDKISPPINAVPRRTFQL